MQYREQMKTTSSRPGFQEASQREAVALAEALERWLDDGGASDKETALNVRVGDCSPLQFFPRPQGGFL